MLHALNTSLENFLRAEVPLPAGQVDIEFRAPDRDWSARLTRPTLDVFLHEVRRSTARSVTGSVTRNTNGAYTREMLSPFVRVRWCISLWTPEPADEHRVLGDVLSLVATTGGIPDTYLVDPIGQLGNGVELSIAGDDVRPATDLWSGLGVAPRLAIELIGVLPVAPPFARSVPVPPEDVRVGVGDQRTPSRRSDLVSTAETVDGAVAGDRTGDATGDTTGDTVPLRRLGSARRSAVEDLGRRVGAGEGA